MLAGRDVAAGAAAVESLDDGNAAFERVDVAVEQDVEDLIHRVVGRFERLDYAFNNAGGTYDVTKPLMTCSQHDWDTVINGNLKGLWHCLKHELLVMTKVEHGSIVNTTGVLGLVAAKNLAAYVAAKHGAIGLTRAAAVEVAGTGVRVNAIAPGSTRRHEGKAQEERRLKAAEQRVPLARLAEPKEIGGVVRWLCSSEASFITGEVLTIDGGWTARI